MCNIKMRLFPIKLRVYEMEVVAIISYAPLWKTLKEKQVTQYQLINNHDIDRRLLSALRANRNITALSIERLCKALECTPNDIVEFLE